MGVPPPPRGLSFSNSGSGTVQVSLNRFLKINGSWHKFSLFRFLNRLYFSEEKKIQYRSEYLVVQLIPHVKSAYHYINCGWGDEAPMSQKRILNVDLSYLPKSTEFFHA